MPVWGPGELSRLLAQVPADNPVRNPVGDMWFVPLMIIMLVGWFLLIRPERRRRLEFEQLIRQLKKNDRVVTSGGIIGTVVNAPEGSEDVTIRVDDSSNTRLRVLRTHILRVLADKEQPPQQTS